MANSLAKKLAEVTGALDWIKKGATANVTQTQSFKYVPAEVVYAKVREELSKRQVAQTVGVHHIEHLPFTTSGGKPSTLTTVMGDLSFIDGETGEIISVPFVGTGADSQDRGCYKAITGGLRDALKANFLIPTGDDPEETAYEGEERPGEAPSKAVVTRNPSSSAPVPPKAERAVVAKSDEVGLSEKQRAMFMARLKEKGFETAAQRKAFLALVVGKHSTTQMTSADLDKALKELDDPTITPQTTVAA